MKMKTWSNNHSYLRSCDLDSQDIQKVKDVLTIVYSDKWNPDEGIGEDYPLYTEEESDAWHWLYSYGTFVRGSQDIYGPSAETFHLLDLGIPMSYIRRHNGELYDDWCYMGDDEYIIDNDEGFCDFCYGYDYEWKVGE